MKSIIDIFRKISTNIKKIVWILGLHAFKLILFFVIIDIVLGGVIFYKYVFLAQTEKVNSAGNVIKFNSRVYQNILKQLNIEEINIEPQSTTIPVSNQENVPVSIELQTETFTFTRFLFPNDTGDDVFKLQEFLLAEGFSSEPPTGNYDEKTIIAVMKFQKANNIRQTGNFAILTKTALEQILALESTVKPQ